MQRFKVFALRLLEHLVEVQTGHAHNLFCQVQLNPRGSLQLRRGVLLQVGTLGSPRIAHHFPAVTREVRAVNDQRRQCPAPRRLLELVGPPAVVGQRFALEKIGIIRGGFVHEEQRHLTVEVDALVIVPVILRSFDSVAHKHDGRIDVRYFCLALVAGYKIGQIFRLE